MSITIRTFGEIDIDFAVAQTSREGWDNTPSTFRVCLAHDPDGCFIAEVGGCRAGMITTTCYECSAWIGNLIVTPDHRRRGIGRYLMEHAIGQIEARGIRTVRLEADPMGVRLYRRLGFINQFESPRFTKQPPHTVGSCPVERLQAADLDTVAAFDAACFGEDRRRMLAELIGISHAAYGIRENGRIVGFAMALPAACGIRLGPCVAENPPTAERLVTAVLADFPGETVIAAVPENNGRMTQLLETKCFTRTSSCLRMTRGEAQATCAATSLMTLADGAMG